MGGFTSAALVALYFEFDMRRYQKVLDKKLAELRSFDEALSAQAGRISSVERELSGVRAEQVHHRDAPPLPEPWVGPRR